MSAEKRKIQFLITPDDADELERIKDEAGLGTLTEVMRHALSWYAWSLRAVKKGNEIQVVDDEGRAKTVVFAGFGGYPNA